MIYRCYSGRPGPACLNTEVAAIAKQIKEGLEINDKQAIEFTASFLDMDLDTYISINEIEKELSIEAIYDEVKNAVVNMKNMKLFDIEDPVEVEMRFLRLEDAENVYLRVRTAIALFRATSAIKASVNETDRPFFRRACNVVPVVIQSSRLTFSKTAHQFTRYTQRIQCPFFQHSL